MVYETNISNNDTNQNILKDNNFTYHHVGNKLIICNNDTTFQLDKMECNYYDFIEMKKELEYYKKYAYGISLKYLQTNETFITNICSNPCAIDIILKYELYNKTIEGLCKNPHPKAFEIIKEKYNDNKFINRMFQFYYIF